MHRLIYFMPMSLDGFIADENNPYKDWSAPDEAVFALISDLHRPIAGRLRSRKKGRWRGSHCSSQRVIV